MIIKQTQAKTTYSIIAVLFCLTATNSLYGQTINDSEPTRYRTQATQVWVSQQAALFVSDTSHHFFVGIESRSSTEPEENELNGWPGYQVFGMGGYRFLVAKSWRAEVSLRSVHEYKQQAVYYQGYIRHNGKIGQKWRLRQRAGLEYIDRRQQTSPDLTRFRLLAELGRQWSIAQKTFEANISYEIFKYFYADKQTVPVQRTIDRTRLRVDAEYALFSYWTIGAFAMWQSDYLFTLLLSNDPNVPPPSGSVRLNRRTPIIGLQAKWRIGKKRVLLNSLPIVWE